MLIRTVAKFPEHRVAQAIIDEAAEVWDAAERDIDQEQEPAGWQDVYEHPDTNELLVGVYKYRVVERLLAEDGDLEPAHIESVELDVESGWLTIVFWLVE